jgi:hypothetical protein
MKQAMLLTTACLLAACGGKAADTTADATADTVNPTATAPAAAPDPPPAPAPAIVSPEVEADPALPPSYEVAVASAAAEHNRAQERCTKQPEAVRAQCEQEANAAFSDAQRNLERLRGNTH